MIIDVTRKDVKFKMWAHIGVCIFCILMMAIAPFFIENYFWQIMLLPFFASLFSAIQMFKLLDNNGI